MNEFIDFIRQQGFDPPHRCEPGRFVRFPTNGKRADKSGYAKLFDDCEGGIVGDFRTGHFEVWQAKRQTPLSEAQHRARREHIERARREAQAERDRLHDGAAEQAQALWRVCREAQEHPYLSSKGVQAHGARIYGGGLVIGEMRCDGALVLPLRNAEGQLRSLEFISETGQKRFLPNGEKTGCYFSIGKPADKICISEGFATGASIHEATGHAVAIAFDAGNLQPVARALREKFPDAELILCADDDIRTPGNPGLTKATEAARAIGGLVAMPDFGPNRPEGATDFNDLAVKCGLDVVRVAMLNARAPVLASAEAAEESAPVEPAPVETQEDEDGWPKPQPLPGQLLAVAPFSFDLLPDELRGWIEDIAQRVQCPPEFPAVAAIAALGSVIGRKLAVRPKARDDWEEFPNLWGVIVGAPGVLKTPALMEALRPLRALEAKAMEENEAKVAAWRASMEGGKIRRQAAKQNAVKAASKGRDFDAAALVSDEDEQEPQPRRYIVNDSSIEAMGLVLQASPNGVLAYRDELIGLLKSLDREGMEGARAFYLSAYSGKEPHVYDRIGRGLNIRVDHVCVSMLGSIQPSVIGRYLREAFDNGGDDGLLSRFSLLVWPDVSGDWINVDRWPDTEARRAANALFERMESLDPEQQMGAELEEGRAPFLRLGEGALAAFVEWRETFERKQRDSEEHPALVAHFAKYRKMVPALALIFHLASRGTGAISEAAVVRALAWAELLETHARRAYASIQQARMEAARALLVKIRAGAVGNPIRPRDVYLKGWSGLSDPEDVRRAAELLADLDYLRAEIAQTPGRSRTVYWINPRVRA